MSKFEVHLWGGIFTRARPGQGHPVIEVEVPGEEATVGEILEGLREKYARPIEGVLWDPQTGQLGGNVNIMVDDKLLDRTEALHVRVRPGDKVAVVNVIRAVAGG